MNYELRTLGAEDIFPMCKIISAIGVKEFKNCFDNDEIRRIAKEGGENPDYSAAGVTIMFDIVALIVSNLPKCKDDLFNFLASISNLSVDEIAKMGMGDFAQMIVDVIHKPEFKDFTGVVSKLFK